MADISTIVDSTSSIDYGIAPTPARSAVHVAFGRTRTLVGLTSTECIFLGISILNIVGALGLTIYQLIKASEEQNYFDIIFTILIIFNAVCCLFYAIHGLLRERAYELYALIAAMIIILLYCIVQYTVTTNSSIVKLVRLIAACILVPLDFILMVLVVKNFGWLEFKIVGASEALQQMYRQTAKFSTLLKFDLQVTISFVILFMKLKLDQTMSISTVELVIVILGIPFSMAWDMLGYIMMRKEIASGAVAFLVLGLVKPGFYLFKIVQLYQALLLPSPIKPSQYMTYTLLTAAAVAMIVWLFLMVELYFVYHNFGKGLKERVFLLETKSSWRRITSDNTQAT